jgi:hypothetical protein
VAAGRYRNEGLSDTAGNAEKHRERWSGVEEEIPGVLPSPVFFSGRPQIFSACLPAFPQRYFFYSQKTREEVIPIIVKEYCESMEKQFAAWRANVEKLLLISEALQGLTPSTDEHRQREDLQSLIDEIGKAAELLTQECLVA